MRGRPSPLRCLVLPAVFHYRSQAAAQICSRQHLLPFLPNFLQFDTLLDILTVEEMLMWVL